MSPTSDARRPSPAMVSLLGCLGIMLATGLVYSPVLTAGLVHNDDRQAIQLGRTWARHYTEVFRPGPNQWSGLADVFTRRPIRQPEGTGGYYQPITTLSLMGDALLTKDWRAAAFQFHLTNLLLHALNTGLIFLTVRRLTRSLLWPLLLASLFAFHPVQVESVAWVSQRMTLLGATFTLLALACYIRYVEATRVRWFLPIVPLFAAAILCRPLFIALPVILLLLDVWPCRRRTLRPILEKVPLFLILLAGVGMQMAVRAQAKPPLAEGPGGAVLLLHNFAALVARLVWPADLSPYHPFETTVGTRALGLGFDIAVTVAIAAMLLVAFSRSKPVFTALVGSLLFVLPALLEAPHTDKLLSDQYLYSALIVPVIVLAAWLSSRGHVLRRLSGRWAAITLAAVVLIFSVQAYAQTFVWHESRDLFARTVRLYPRWAFGYIGLVESYIRDNDLDAALRWAEEAERVEPDNPSAQFYLGTVLLLHRDGRSRQAIEPLRKALASDPHWIECLQNLGVALARSGRTLEAISYLETARDLEPESADIRVGLGHAYLKVRRFASARKEFQLALKHHNDAMTHLGLAIAWAANEEPRLARRHLAAAIAKDPRSAERAARSAPLRRYRSYPGFDTLLHMAEDAAGSGDAAVTESPAARRAHGS